MTLAASSGWWIGWGIALVVVLIAAALLLAIIGLGRRIVRQADDITAALDGTRANTAPLFDVVSTNFEIDRITRGLRAARTGERERDDRLDEPDRPGHGPSEALRKGRAERGA